MLCMHVVFSVPLKFPLRVSHYETFQASDGMTSSHAQRWLERQVPFLFQSLTCIILQNVCYAQVGLEIILSKVCRLHNINTRNR